MNNTNTAKQVKEWRLDSNIVLLYPKYENMSDLEIDWDKFISMNKELQNDSDEKSLEVFGSTNKERYEIMLHQFYDNDSIDKNEFHFNKNNHTYDDDANNLQFIMSYDRDRYFYLKYSSYVQEALNEFDLSEEARDEIEYKIFENNPDFIDETVAYPYYLPEEIEYYDRRFKDVKLPIKESLFIANWKKVYTEAFDTGNFSKLRDMESEWKSNIAKAQSNSRLSPEAKNKILLNLGCNYALPINTDKPIDRVPNIIRDIHNQIRVYDAYANKQSSLYNDTTDDYRKFLDTLNFWVVVDTASRSVTAYSITAHKFEETIAKTNKSVYIYCTSIPESKAASFANIFMIPANNVLDLKLLVSSITKMASPIKLFKVFNGEANTFSLNCYGIGLLYHLYKDKSSVNESALLFTEANTTNEFPVEFNQDGDLLISKGRKIDFEGEYSRTHLALKIYEKNGNIVGMKYCICKLWYLNIKLEEKIHDKNTSVEEKKKAEKARSKIVNDITKYSQIVLKKDPNFDIIKTYQNSPFNDDKIRVPTSTLTHTIEWIKRLLKIKKGL